MSNRSITPDMSPEAIEWRFRQLSELYRVAMLLESPEWIDPVYVDAPASDISSTSGLDETEGQERLSDKVVLGHDDSGRPKSDTNAEEPFSRDAEALRSGARDPTAHALANRRNARPRSPLGTTFRGIQTSYPIQDFRKMRAERANPKRRELGSWASAYTPTP